ncbi:DUF3310 domain-containing protein [Jeotgalibaca porci]|uniref:DUF3310 domain-containing protein n=1 Tax=Jeotgalibaca porci TaxID=1868793 RepID=UPI0035A18935
MKLPEWAKWLARDEDDRLYAFEIEPIKRIGLGAWADDECGCERVYETDDTFEDIHWTDEEPTSVKALIKEFSDKAESLRELGEALTRNWEAEHGKPSVAEYNQWQITQAKAHGYDELPELSNPDIINEPNHYKGKHGIESTDLVNHPNHYKQGGLETIDIMQALLPHEQFIGYLKGNIIKYRERAEHKGNAEQDYAKAKWYYDKLIEHTEAIE